MALNLSTLTNSATSASILNEALTTADFLDPVPILANLANRGNKGGDAKQTTALSQPKALPLVDGKGYCYLPGTTGNAPAVNFPTIGASDDFVLEMKVYIVETNGCYLVTGGNSASRLFVTDSLFLFSSTTSAALSSALSEGPSTIRIERTSGSISLYQNNVLKSTPTADSATYSFTHLSFNGQFSSGIPALNGYIQTCTLSIGGTEQLNIDFTATNVRHGDTKIKCATGQVVTINQDSSSSNDVATIIKRPVLRFDGVNDNLKGLLGSTVTEGYAFLAFSVLGGGGEQFATCFGLNSTGGSTISTDGYAITHRNSERLQSFNSNVALDHTGLFDDANGDILHEVKFKSGSQISKINNADQLSSSATTTISSEEFSIAERVTNGLNTSFDLEYLALFPASITDDQADDVRNFINNRNNVFSLIDSQGYYFYDAQKAPVGNITDVNTWSGRIVGSDNGDSASIISQQATANDQPVGDGYVVTFADNTDHLTIPSTTQAGWQVVGTSLGTFAYRVNANAVTELNLLGNLGQTVYRKAGDLYGVILLPESATGADIEAARSLLIDRGAADGTTSGSIFTYWYNRDDIVEFKYINTSSVTLSNHAWYSCQALEKFPALDLSNSTTLNNAWFGCTALSDFGAIQADSCADFTSAFQGCSALSSFPSGAKLGTSASNVNFTSAWRSSGLTSFSTPLPTAINCLEAWRGTSISQFNLASLPEATVVISAWRETDLTSFSTSLPSIVNAAAAWLSVTTLVDFADGVFDNWNPTSINSGVFNAAWDGCSALSAQSVENILTSIDASGKYATSTGASGGSALADAGIDIDYNVATGSLSAATNTAVTSLKSKGWSIIVNNVTL